MAKATRISKPEWADNFPVNVVAHTWEGLDEKLSARLDSFVTPDPDQMPSLGKFWSKLSAGQQEQLAHAWFKLTSKEISDKANAEATQAIVDMGQVHSPGHVDFDPESRINHPADSNPWAVESVVFYATARQKSLMADRFVADGSSSGVEHILSVWYAGNTMEKPSQIQISSVAAMSFVGWVESAYKEDPRFKSLADKAEWIKSVVAPLGK